MGQTTGTEVDMSTPREMTATISADLLRVMERSGVQWVVLFRSGSTLSEAQAYAWGNTLVFEYYDSIFLLAMTKGEYVADQLERYASGLWGFIPINSLDGLDEAAIEAANRIS